jgi:hypothetical protein
MELRVADPYAALKGKTVYRASDLAAVDIPSLWGEGERVVVVWGRSMG